MFKMMINEKANVERTDKVSIDLKPFQEYMNTLRKESSVRIISSNEKFRVDDFHLEVLEKIENIHFPKSLSIRFPVKGCRFLGSLVASMESKRTRGKQYMGFHSEWYTEFARFNLFFNMDKSNILARGKSLNMLRVDNILSTVHRCPKV